MLSRKSIRYSNVAVSYLVATICKINDLYFVMVPGAGLEPARGCPLRILSPVRLPFRHPGGGDFKYNDWKESGGTFPAFLFYTLLSIERKPPKSPFESKRMTLCDRSLVARYSHISRPQSASEAKV